MFDVLRQFGVSCVAPSDKIFKPIFSIKKSSDKTAQNANDISQDSQEIKSTVVNNDETIAAEFNAEILKIYKKIPTEGDCTIDSLVDSDFTLKEVMRALLKLEVGRFVTLLPGERVKRNLK